MAPQLLLQVNASLPVQELEPSVGCNGLGHTEAMFPQFQNVNALRGEEVNETNFKSSRVRKCYLTMHVET